MSKHISDFDMENLDADDFAYFDQRPWLKAEYENQTGNKFSDIERPEAEEEDDDLDAQDSPEVAALKARIAEMEARQQAGAPEVTGSTTSDSTQQSAGDDEDLPPYLEWEYNDLLKELSDRNEDREEDDKIVPDSRSKEDVAAALDADDEANEE